MWLVNLGVLILIRSIDLMGVLLLKVINAAGGGLCLVRVVSLWAVLLSA